ncbi:exported hypothetical protein [Candidatus Magnetomoraceae bacterium gMMP-15]
MKRLFAICLILVFGVAYAGAATSEWSADIQTAREEGDVFSKPKVTIGVASEYSKISAPPLPPKYSCDAAIVDTSDGSKFLKEIKQEGEDKYEWILAVNPHGTEGGVFEDRTATMSWDFSGIEGSFSLYSGANSEGDLAVSDMKTITQYDVTGLNSDQYFTIVFEKEIPLPVCPTISDIPDQTIDENYSTDAINFTVADEDTSLELLNILAESSDTILIPDENIVFGGSGADRTVTVVPAKNKTGTATITVTVSDGSLTAEDSFTVTVNEVPGEDPVILNLPEQEATDEDTPTDAIFFEVGDSDTLVDLLVVSGNSSDATLVPDGNIVFAGSDANRTVTVTPADNKFGEVTITIQVEDNVKHYAEDSFVLTITPVNDPPTISDISDQEIGESITSDPISFTVVDVDLETADSLEVSASSSYTNLIPNENIVFGGSDANRTVTITPADNYTGTATITVIVTDEEGLTDDTSFEVTVKANAPPDQPVLESPTDGAIVDSLTPELKTGTFIDEDEGDTHAKTKWQISKADNSLIVFEATTESDNLTSLTSLTVPELVLDGNTEYSWNVIFEDSRGKASECSDAFSFTTSANEEDENGNGIPDDQEAECIDLNGDGVCDITPTKSVNTVVGDGQIGVSASDSATITYMESVEIPDSDNKPDNVEFELGLINFKLEVESPGYTATVTVYFSEPVPDNAKWYKYDSINGWDYIPYEYATFNEDGSVTLELKDGGYGDADGVENGIIIDPSGFGVETTTDGGGDGGGGGGCFISSSFFEF